MDAPQVINIGRADTTEAPTLKLNVGSDTEMGAIKLQKEPKSVNFGPGVEMLMNPKKTTTPRNVNLGDIETLDGDLNKKMGINKSDALKNIISLILMERKDYFFSKSCGCCYIPDVLTKELSSSSWTSYFLIGFIF